MTVMGKFVAVVVGIAMFVMPAAAMPLHCILMVPLSGGENPEPCHMLGMLPSADDQINAAPVDLSCCAVSAALPESIIVPRVPADSGTLVPATSVAFSSDLPPVQIAYDLPNGNAPSPGGPSRAVLCTFLI